MAETVVYREEQINRDTGEIIVERKVVKEKISNRDQFVRVFSQNGDAFKNLTLGEYKILLELLSGDYINYSNEIILSPAIRKRISDKVALHRVTLNKSLSTLCEKEILLKKDDYEKDFYKLNPFYFGRGSWADIVLLRQSVAMEFNLKTNEMVKTIETQSLTKKGLEILKNPNNYNLLEVNNKKHDSTNEEEYIVEHKQPTLFDD